MAATRTKAGPIPTVGEVREALRALATDARRTASLRFFKTGPGDYGEGDRFLGVSVPDQRVVARRFAALPIDAALGLLESPVHEERLTALLILVRHFEKGDEAARRRVFDGYLARARWVNNWDLVDSSAPQIVGGWLLERDRRVLDRLVRSPSLWERRIAVLSTLAFIRAGQGDDTLRLCEAVLGDEHDLMHKASGWMLREVGKRVDVALLRAFLSRHAAHMPRTMLRYALEHLPKAERLKWMAA